MYLKNRLIIGFMIMLVTALLITGSISTGLINSHFNQYLLMEHERKLATLFDFAEGILQGRSDMSLEDLNLYAVSENYYFEILDGQGQLLYGSSNQVQQGMMGGRLTLDQMRNSHMFGKLTIENRIVETKDGEKYLIQVAFEGDFSVSQEASRFKTMLYQSIFVALIISVGISMFLSMAFSKPLASAFSSAAEAAEAIARGKLDTRLPEKNQIIEIQNLHQAMNTMAKTLEEQEYLRKHLVEAINHEVKTPLTVLKSQLEAFMDGVFEPDQTRFQNCHDEILRLETLLDRMGQVHELNAQKYVMRLTVFSLKEEIETICHILKPQFDKKRIELQIFAVSEMNVEMDRYKLRQILYNLFSNAFKFSNEGTVVSIELSSHADKAVVQIRNQGLKISDEDCQRIFDLQYRASDASGYDPHGKGLGLRIASDLTAFMKGDLRLVESTVDQTIFELVLPFRLDRELKSEE